jgi:hypothetical protein
VGTQFINRESEVRILPGALLFYLQIPDENTSAQSWLGPLYITSTSPGYSPIAASIAPAAASPMSGRTWL